MNKSWTTQEVSEIYNKPLMELIFDAAQTHRQHHNPLEVQISTLLSIKTGGCPEDCGYCPQAARYNTGIEGNDLMSVSQVKAQALRAKANGSSRLCMGAAWRNIQNNEEFDQVLEMVQTVNNLEMEVCCTLGMMTEEQAQRLANAGLYAYNHNLDTSEDHYKEIISTRDYQDRIKTIENASKAGISVCSGGIVGMGESVEDRCGMLVTLANMKPQPKSVPINALVAVEGTPLEEQETISIWEMVRMVATTRIVMPKAVVRLSAGRTEMSDEGQALCFMSGASSIFAGDKLLTTPNPDINQDMKLFDILGITAKKPFVDGEQPISKDDHKKCLSTKGNVKWSRPEHTIERNEKAKKKGKLKKDLSAN
ncbi:biotin synthase BioB [Flavobacteriales bacterium]|jgi:biotin synthase|nr:biotin synthase BioB [Flavobacteriales bacterium]